MRHDIKNAKDARAAIGKRVKWVERAPARMARQFERGHSGMLEDVKGKNMLISGDWKWRPDLVELHFED